MAEKVKGIIIEIGGDTTGLDKALKAPNKTIASLQKELREVENGLKFNPGNVELLGQKATILAKEVEEASGKLRTLKDVQAQVQAQFERGEIGEDQYRAFQREIITTESKLNGLQGKLDATNTLLANGGKAARTYADELQDAGKKLDEAGTKIKNAGDKTAKVGEGLTKYVTAPILALGAVSIAAFNDVDNMLDTITTATGATGDALESLHGSAENIASKTKFEFEDIGRAVGEVNTQFGSFGEGLERESEKLLKFADITDGDVVTSTQNAKQAMQAYNLETKDLDMILDNVAKTAQNTGVSVDTLFQASIDGAYQIKEMGLSFGEGVAMMGQFEKAGVDASKALTYMSKAAVVYAQDGKTLEEGLAATIDKIKNASSETEALTTASEIFGTRGATAMIEAIRRGTFSLEALEGAAESAAGTVETTFDNTVDPIDKAKVSMNNAKLALADLGEVAQKEAGPAFDEITEITKDVSKWLKSLDDDTKKNIVRWAALAAAAGPVVVVLGKVTSGVGSIVKSSGHFITWLGQTAAGFTTVGTAGTAAGVGTTAAAAGTTAAGAAATTATPGVIGFGAAINAALLPLSLIVGAAALLGVSIAALSGEFSKGDEAARQFRDDIDDMSADVKALADTMAQSEQSYRDNAESIEAQAIASENLADEITELAAKEGKTASDKVKLNTLIGMLNKSVDGLNLSYDEQKDQLNMTNEAIKANIGLQKEKLMAQAQEERALELAKEVATAQMQAAETAELRRQAVLNLRQANEEYNRVMEESKDPLAYNQLAINGATNNVIAYSNALEEARAADEAANTTRTEAEAKFNAMSEAMVGQQEQLAASTAAVDENTASSQENAITQEELAAAIEAAGSRMEAASNQILGAYDTMSSGLADLGKTIEENDEKTWATVKANQDDVIAKTTEFADLYGKLINVGVSEAYLKAIGATGPESIPLLKDMLSEGASAIRAEETEWRAAYDTITSTLADSLASGDADVKTAIENLITGENGIAPALKTSLAEALKPENFAELAAMIPDGIKQGMEGSAELATTAAEKLALDILTKFGQDTLKINSPSKAFSDIAAGIPEGVAEGVKDNTDLAKTAVTDMALEQIKAFEEKLQEFKRAGSDSAQGAIDGVLEKKSAAYSAGAELARAVNEGYKNTLDQHSPSRLMRSEGRDTGQGAILGILDMIPDARAASQRFAAELYAASHGEIGSPRRSAKSETASDETTPGGKTEPQQAPINQYIYITFDRATIADETFINIIADKVGEKTARALKSVTRLRTAVVT